MKKKVEKTQNKNLDSAIALCNNYLDSARRNDDKIIEAYALYYLGSTYDMKGKYENAYNCYFKALSIFEKSDDARGLAGCLNNIGIVLWEQSSQVKGEGKIKKLNKALDYLNESLHYFKKINYKNGIGNCLMNKGIAYNDLGNYQSDKALKTKFFEKSAEFYKQAASVFEEIGNRQGLADCDMNVALMSFELFTSNDTGILTASQYKTINKYLLDALNGFHNVGDLYGESMVLKNLATIRVNRSKLLAGNEKKQTLKEAIAYAKEALAFADSAKALYLQYDAYYELYRINKLLGNYKKALVNHELYLSLKDTVHQNEQFKVMEEMESRYNAEKKEQQLKIQEVENKRQRTTLIAVTIVLIISLLLGFILFRFYKQKQLANIALNNKNEELEKLNNTQNKLISIISHDLKAPVSAFLAITNSLKSNLDKLSEEETVYYIERMANSALGLKMQFDNLLNWALSQRNGIKVDKKLVYLAIIVEKVRAVLDEAAREKGLEIVNKVPDEMQINTDPKLLGIALNNLISNAVKFSKPGDNIDVGAKKDNGSVTIWVKDRGAGMKPEDMAAVFSNEGLKHKSENSGTGLGLAVTKEIVEKLGGRIYVESKLNKGSTFYMEFYE